MISYDVRVHASDEDLPRDGQLAWRIAEMAAETTDATPQVTEMVINRVIDNAAVAAASIARRPVATARAQALDHPYSPGATVFGVAAERRVSPEWAAWANGVAVRELDFHDTFLAEEYSHPGDNIPPILAVAQHAAVRRGLSGADLVRAISVGYEVQIDLARSISLHKHKIDHVAHLGPSVAAGLGALLGLPAEVIFSAIGQALHTTTATRQSRKGEISSWKAFAPAFAGKAAIEATDRAVRGESSPTPIYEGEDGVIARLLAGPEASYSVSLPERGEPRAAILDSFTKEHSAEYQAQAWIDLACRLGRRHPRLGDPRQLAKVVIRTSNHTHVVIGSGAHDPQKYSPDASRETLDHSLPYIFAVALQDGRWHHVDSYARARTRRPDTVELWRKVTTVEDPEWTRRYLSADVSEKAFGGAVEITLADGSVIADEIAVADAHPLGARPFAREDYVRKFRTLADGVIEDAESRRFLELAERLPELTAEELAGLTLSARPGVIDGETAPVGLF